MDSKRTAPAHSVSVELTKLSDDPLELQVSIGSVILVARSKGAPKMSTEPAAVCSVCKGSGFSHENHKCQFCDGPTPIEEEETELTNSSPPDTRALVKTLLNRIVEHPEAMKQAVIGLRSSKPSTPSHESVIIDLITKARNFPDPCHGGDRRQINAEAVYLINNLANELEKRL